MKDAIYRYIIWTRYSVSILKRYVSRPNEYNCINVMGHNQKIPLPFNTQTHMKKYSMQ